jgi:capsule biosynthesis phosphatase
VTHPLISGDYTSVLPIQRNIDYLKYLKELGHTILIYTARRMKTHKGNVGSILADVGKITFETLDKFNIPYDEIYFGKPYANFYIDDLAINANSSLDKALGIYNTDISPRSFNKIEYNNSTVIKETANDGEIYWYENIPESISDLFPKVLNIQNNTIELERINGVNFSYLYTNKILTWEDIQNALNSLNRVHSSFPYDDNSINIYSNYSKKLTKRFLDNKELYIKYKAVNAYNKINVKLIKYEECKEGMGCIIHGDPVFTNILKTEYGVKFIDMRGKQENKLTMFGDIYYDYAKIYQSLIGYDFILNNIEIDNTYIDDMIFKFENRFTTKANVDKIKLITASLILSLLPLHEEDENKFKKYIKLVNTLI